jgi:hypothetical protein
MIPRRTQAGQLKVVERLAARILLLGGRKNRDIALLLGLAERNVSLIKTSLRPIADGDAGALRRVTLAEIGAPEDDVKLFRQLADHAHALITRNEAATGLVERRKTKARPLSGETALSELADMPAVA